MVEKERLCDLHTSDKTGSDLILREYPGRLTEKQIQRTKVGRKINYAFLGLDRNEVQNFLGKYPVFEHMIIDRTS
jgi:hypothetical protein